jgi:hypothetical protein
MEPKTVHVFGRVIPIEGGEFSSAYLTFNEDRELICLGAFNYERMPDKEFAFKKMIRDSLNSTLRQYEPRNIYLHFPEADNPSLELGRLKPEIREKTQRRNISTKNQLEGCEESLLNSLAKQTNVSFWESKRDVDIGEPPYTIHTDGSYFGKNEASTGYIIVDSGGRVVDVDSDYLCSQGCSLQAEFIAVRDALKRVNSFQCSPDIKLKVDCFAVRNILLGNQSEPPRLRCVVEQTRNELRSCGNTQITKIYRSNNTFADALASNVKKRKYKTKLANAKPRTVQESSQVTTKYSV